MSTETQVSRFREESLRLLDEIRDLKASISISHSPNHPESPSHPHSLPLDHEELVIEEISRILGAKLSQTLSQTTKHTLDSLAQTSKKIEISCQKLISDSIAKFRPHFAPPEFPALSDASLVSKIDSIGNIVRENFRENSVHLQETLASEKRRLEAEYQRKFETYKSQMDAYIKEISEKFPAKENEMHILFSKLSTKIDQIPSVPIPASQPVSAANHPSAATSPSRPQSASVARLEEIYAHDVPALQAKLRRLWSATEPGTAEVLGFLERLERALFMGERIDKVYETEIRKCKDKLPVIQLAAKLAFFRARDDADKAADLEIELAQKSKIYSDRWGERIHLPEESPVSLQRERDSFFE